MKNHSAGADNDNTGESVTNRTIEFMVERGWNAATARRSLSVLSGLDAFVEEREEILDLVPAMSSTALGLEILLGEPCIDLSAVAELVLSDVGATLQILRIVGKEYAAAVDRPARMVECLSSLDVHEWSSAVARRTYICDRAHVLEASAWEHRRQVARYAQFVAESMDSVRPEEAYLVGLLHDVEEIACLTLRNGASFPLQAMQAAIEGVMPPFVLEAIRCAEDAGSTSSWRYILNAAHELAGCGILNSTQA